MNWLRQWLGKPVLDTELRARLDAWKHTAPVSASMPLDQAYMVLVDVESTGLNPARDHLLAIGAVPVEGDRLLAGAGFERILAADESGPRDTILIHGITPTAVATGDAPPLVLMDFLEYAGKHPLVAYHAGFDEAMLGRALRKHLGVRLPNIWLDLAWIAPGLFPELRMHHQPLDAWLEHFNLRAHTRHRALADCLVTGEFLLILFERAKKKELHTVGDLMMLEKLERHNSQTGLYGGM